MKLRGHGEKGRRVEEFVGGASAIKDGPETKGFSGTLRVVAGDDRGVGVAEVVSLRIDGSS